MTSRLGDYWQRVAQNLGVEVIAPFALTLPNGEKLVVDALVKNFGGQNGMLLVDDYARIRDRRAILVKMGYGFSTLSAPIATEPDNVDVLREVLSDWGWSGSLHKKPEWVTEPPDDDE